jgi:phospholipid-binding lipoprotein MlaA
MHYKLVIIFLLTLLRPFCLLANSIEGYYDLYYFNNQNPRISQSALGGECVDQIEDPFQPVNQIIFDINYVIDLLVIEPTAYIYQNVTPKVGQERVKNLFEHLSSPITFLNLILQGKFEQASDTLGRFITNSTIGFAGLVDVASEFGVSKNQTDFGMTLAHYGFKGGPYLVLPIIGPTSARDLLGKGVDFFSDPISRNLKNKTNVYLGIGKIIYVRSDNYELINNIKYNSLDSYTFMKTVYYQNRLESEKDQNETIEYK